MHFFPYLLCSHSIGKDSNFSIITKIRTSFIIVKHNHLLDFLYYWFVFFPPASSASTRMRILTLSWWQSSSWQVTVGLDNIFNTFDDFDDLLRYDAANNGIHRAIVNSIKSCEVEKKISASLLFYIFSQISHAVQHLIMHR